MCATTKHSLYTNMLNIISLEQIKNWEKLVDLSNTGEDIQALECYFLDEDWESCWIDEAVKVCFNAYDYDNKHDFDTLRSTLSKVGVELTDGGYETEQDTTKEQDRYATRKWCRVQMRSLSSGTANLLAAKTLLRVQRRKISPVR